MLSFNVADLLRSAPGTSRRIAVSEADLLVADDVRLSRPIEGRVDLISTGRGILVRGHLETALEEGCSRCLRPAEASISFEFEDEALPSVDLESGLPLDTDEEPDALRLNDHHELDLTSTVRDAISLAEPIAPLCRPDCPGLCVTCGADLTTNVGHGHEDEEVDPRLAALAGLRERLQ